MQCHQHEKVRRMIYVSHAYFFLFPITSKIQQYSLIFLVVKIHKQEFEFFLRHSYERNEESRLSCKL